MKKQMNIFYLILTTLLLSACSEGKVEYIEVQVPVTVEKEVIVEVEVPVEVPVEVIKEVPVIKEVYVDSETKVVIDAANTRSYLPGSYVNHIETTDGVYYATIVVDQMGELAGIQFDKQLISNDVYVSLLGDYYVYVKGDGSQIPDSYRNIEIGTLHMDYPTIADAIDATDLVSGIDNTEIDDLVKAESFETSSMLDEDWLKSATLLADQIVKDQSTYGITTTVSGTVVTTTNVALAKNSSGIDIVLTNVDILLALVQDVLNGEAYLRDSSVLPTAPTYGIYTPGVYTTGSEREYDESTGIVSQAVLNLVVDEYGQIAGASSIDLNGLTTDESELVEHQSVASSNLFRSLIERASDFTFAAGTYTAFDEQSNTMMYVRIGDQTKTELAYSNGPIPLLTKNVTTDYEQAIQSIIVDSFSAIPQATITIEDEEFPLYTYQQMYIDTDGEDATRTVELYLDGSTYYAVAPLGYAYYPAVGDVDQIDHLDDVTMTPTELNTISPVKGVTTTALQSEETSNLLTAYFENTYSPYILGENKLDVSMDDSLIQSMLVDALHKAKAAYELEQEGNYIEANALKFSPYHSNSTNTTKLADGIYAADTFSTFDGSIMVGYMEVKNHVIEQMIFDQLLYDKTAIQSQNSLGDNSVVDTPDTNKDFEDIVTMDADLLLNDVDETFVAHLLSGYTYDQLEVFKDTSIETARADLLVDGTFTSAANGPYYKDLLFSLTLEAARARVSEIASSYGTLLEELPSTTGVMYEGKELDLPMYNSTHNLLESDVVDFRISFDYTNTDFLDDHLNTLNPTLFVDEVVTSAHKETVTMTLTYDTYQFTYDATFEVVPLATIAKNFVDLMKTSYLYETTTNTEIQFDLYGINGMSIIDSDTSKALYKNYDTAHNYYPTDLPVLWYELDGTTMSTLPLNFTDGNSDGKVVYSELTDYNVSTLQAGIHHFKMRLYYKEGSDGYLGTADDSFIEQLVTITVLSNSDAVTLVTPEVIPGTLVPHGNITKSSYQLPTVLSVEGLSIDWTLPDGVNVSTGTVQPTGLLQTEDSITSYINTNDTLLAYLVEEENNEMFKIIRGSEDQTIRLDANLVTADGTVLSTIPYEFIVKEETPLNLADRLNLELKEYYQNIPEYLFVDTYVTSGTDSEELLISATDYPETLPYTTDSSITLTYDHAMSTLKDGYYISWGDADGVLDDTIADDYYVLFKQVDQKDELVQSYTVNGLKLPTRTIIASVDETTPGGVNTFATDSEDVVIAYLSRSTGAFYLATNTEFDGFEAGVSQSVPLELHTTVIMDQNNDELNEFESDLTHRLTLINETNSISLITSISNNSGALTIQLNDDYVRLLKIENSSLPTIFVTSGDYTFVPEFDTNDTTDITDDTYKLTASSTANDGTTTYSGKTSTTVLELFLNGTRYETNLVS